MLLATSGCGGFFPPTPPSPDPQEFFCINTDTFTWTYEEWNTRVEQWQGNLRGEIEINERRLRWCPNADK
jgi:hypothetical protein